MTTPNDFDWNLLEKAIQDLEREVLDLRTRLVLVEKRRDRGLLKRVESLEAFASRISHLLRWFLR